MAIRPLGAMSIVGFHAWRTPGGPNIVGALHDFPPSRETTRYGSRAGAAPTKKKLPRPPARPPPPGVLKVGVSGPSSFLGPLPPLAPPTPPAPAPPPRR